MSDVDLPPALAGALGGQVGLLLFSTPDEWLHQVHDATGALAAALEDAAAAAAREIEELDSSRLAVLGGAVSLPLGGLIALQSEQVKDDLRARLADAVTALTSRLTELVAEIERVAGTLLGDPAGLGRLAESYLGAKQSLDGAIHLGRTEGGQLDVLWDGRGQRAFAVVAEQQLAAMADVSQRLRTAATLVSEAAEAIKLTWSAIMQALVALHARLVEVLATAFDAGNIVTMEIGPAIELVSITIDHLNACTTPVREVNSRAETVDRTQWLALGSAPAFEGGTDWPRLQAQHVQLYTPAEGWEL